MPGVSCFSWSSTSLLLFCVFACGVAGIVADERNVSELVTDVTLEDFDLDLNTTLNETAPVTSNSSSVFVSGDECPGCAEKKRRQEETMTPAEIRKIRIKMFKEQILNKLNLKTKPNVQASRTKLPDILFKKEVLGVPESDSKTAVKNLEEYENTKKVVLFPTNSTSNYSCSSDQSNASRCFTFQISSRDFAGGVTSAYFFLYKNTDHPHDQSLVITEVVSTGFNRTIKERIVKIEDNPSKSGWLRFEMKPTLERWIFKPHLQHSFQITCKGKGCQGSAVPVSISEKHRPFIVITTGPVLTVSRKKRDTVCTEKSTNCCKESLVITFEEIGWGDWVIHPSNFTANYCRGPCNAQLDISRYPHTSVMQKYISSKKAPISLCCSPSRLSSMSIIYMRGDNTVQQTEMSDMIVQDCECA